MNILSTKINKIKKQTMLKLIRKAAITFTYNTNIKTLYKFSKSKN